MPENSVVPTRGKALRFALAYAVLGALWIFFSSRLLHHFVPEGTLRVLIEDCKGWGFVLVTACLLGLVLDLNFRRIRRSVQTIQESEARLHLLGDRLPDSYVYRYTRDPDGRQRFNYISAGVERVHGVVAVDVLRDASCLLGQMDPAQLPEIAIAEAESARTLQDVEMELRAQRADGQLRTLQVRCRPSRNCQGQVEWDGFAQDITERKRTEHVLRLQGAALEAAANAILITDRHGTIEWVNPAFTQFTGYTADEIIGRNARVLNSGKHDNVFYQNLWSTILAGNTWCKEMVNRRKDGSLYDEEMTITPLRDSQGDISHFIAIRQDISKRKRLEAQFQQAQKMEAIGQLAGGVAHDFNNILAAMMMQADIAALSPDLPQDVREGLRQIRSATDRAASLTRQLLLFSRKQVMQPRDLDLNELVTSLAKMLQRIIGEDIRLNLHLHPAPLVTLADPGMLDQVLMNLAVNARDAMPQGGRLLIETGQITIEPSDLRLYPEAKPGKYVSLCVTDTGDGIPPDILPRIFEPFFTTKEVGKGTGLGLATVFGIARQHQGWIHVQSQLGQGSTFQVFLPASAKSLLDDRLPAPRPRGGRETILLAEDDSTMRLTTRKMLERYGYHVLEAANGVQALGIWQQHLPSVAILLTDLVMPGGISGRQLARRLLQDKPTLKVILTSGYSPDIAGSEIELLPGENFLQKPYPPHHLLDSIRHALDN